MAITYFDIVICSKCAMSIRHRASLTRTVTIEVPQLYMWGRGCRCLWEQQPFGAGHIFSVGARFGGFILRHVHGRPNRRFTFRCLSRHLIGLGMDRRPWTDRKRKGWLARLIRQSGIE